MKNPYRVLGVAETATGDEIRRAFRRLVLVHHPDRHPNDPGAAARMAELNAAYAELSTPERRRPTDAKLAAERFSLSRPARPAAPDARHLPFMYLGFQISRHRPRSEALAWQLGGLVIDILRRM